MKLTARPKMPTYLSSAEFLERKTGSGWKLIGWTVLRTLLIAPPMMIVGVDSRRAWSGAFLASGFISGLALLRIFNAGPDTLSGARRRRAVSMKRRHALRA